MVSRIAAYLTHAPGPPSRCRLLEAISVCDRAAAAFERVFAAMGEEPQDESMGEAATLALFEADARLAGAIREAAGVDAGVMASAGADGRRYVVLPDGPEVDPTECRVVVGPSAEVLV